MRRQRWQVARALRVLLACLVVTLSAGPSGEARVWAETPVLLAPASRAAGAAVARAFASRATLEVSARPLAVAPAACAMPPPAETPRPPAADGVLVLEDRYLRNCALLC